jgi:hypothetical protein
MIPPGWGVGARSARPTEKVATIMGTRERLDEADDNSRLGGEEAGSLSPGLRPATIRARQFVYAGVPYIPKCKPE